MTKEQAADLVIRLECEADRRAVENLTREAFWDNDGAAPPCGEHLLVHRFHGLPCFVPELDFVALSDGEIVGHILYTRAKVVDEAGAEHAVLTFGPLSVLPAYQCTGIGSALVRHSVEKARALGHRAIIFYGHPDYYPRFGFLRAKTFGITSESGRSFDALMALPLWEGSLDDISGRFIEDPAYSVDKEDAIAFDKGFPPKAPSALLPVDTALPGLSTTARRALAEHNVRSLYDLRRYSRRKVEAWRGIGPHTMEAIDRALRASGLPPKEVYPDA